MEFKRVQSVNKTPYPEDYSLRILERKPWLICVDLAGPEQNMAVPPLRDPKATTQIHQENAITHTKHYNSLYKLIKLSNSKAHTLMIRLANKSDISLAFYLSWSQLFWLRNQTKKRYSA